MASKLYSLSIHCRKLISLPNTRAYGNTYRFRGSRLKNGRFAGFTPFFHSGLWRAGFKERDVLPSLEQRLAALNPFDAEVERLVNIGPKAISSNKEQKKIHRIRRAAIREAHMSAQLEKAARHRTLRVPLDEVMEEWTTEQGPEQICGAALHYGIFEDLFGSAYFVPTTVMRTTFPSSSDYETPVYRGNHVAPADARSAPMVDFTAPEDSLWTLILTNLDGNLQDSDSEYVHWFVGNIPGGKIAEGNTIADYMQPIPARGTGFHRFVFTLFRQRGIIDYSDFSKLKESHHLHALPVRTFRMEDFYRTRQQDLLPSGMAFFLAEWDESVTDYFHEVLDMPEPAFEYQHRPLYIRPQRKYPKGEPFNLYLDRYRDPKEIAEEMVKKRMKQTSPFAPDLPRSKWPMAQPISLDIPSWKRMEIRKERLGIYRYKLIYNPLAEWGWDIQPPALQ